MIRPTSGAPITCIRVVHHSAEALVETYCGPPAGSRAVSVLDSGKGEQPACSISAPQDGTKFVERRASPPACTGETPVSTCVKSPHGAVLAVRPPLDPRVWLRRTLPRCSGSHEQSLSSLLEPDWLSRDQGSPSSSGDRAWWR